MRSIYFLGGILSNYRTLLPEAVEVGRSHGFHVAILDVVNLVPRWTQYPNPWEELGLLEHVTRFEDRGSLEGFCARHGKPDTPRDRQDIVFFFHPPNEEIRWIWDLLDNAGFAVGVMTLNPVPIIREAPGWRGLIDKLVKRPLRRLKAMTKPVPYYWIISGAKTEDCYRTFFRHTRNTRFILAHSVDYEAYRDAGLCDSDEPEGPAQHILFLDQGWYTKLRRNFRPDGRYPPTREDVYRESIVAWLTSLQSESGLRVIVSAHPKGGIEPTRKIYPGLEVSDLPTASLVNDARFVIGNCSTSLQFAVMANKPVCLFSSDELNQSLMLPGMRGYQRSLNATVVNIDHPPDTRDLLATLRVDESHYGSFLHDYIIHRDSGDESLWEKIVSQLATAR